MQNESKVPFSQLDADAAGHSNSILDASHAVLVEKNKSSILRFCSKSRETAYSNARGDLAYQLDRALAFHNHNAASLNKQVSKMLRASIRFAETVLGNK